MARLITRKFRLISLVFFACLIGQSHYGFAQDTDKTEFLLKFNSKLESSAKFALQYHKSETVKFPLKDMYTDTKYMNTRVIQKKVPRHSSFKGLERFLGNSFKCDYERTLEVRYIDPVDLSCAVVKPLEDEDIQYNPIVESVYLDAIADGIMTKSWERVDNYDEADLGLLVEFEITNAVDVVKGGLRLRLTNAIQRYKPFHLVGLRITGVNLDPEASEKIVFKAYLLKPFIEYPSEETLTSLINEVGVKIGKQKSFGFVGSHSLKFKNFEKVDK